MEKVKSSLPKITYSPSAQLRRPGQLIRNMFRDLLISRELSMALAKRDISAQYRQSFLGYIWAFLPVLGTTAVFLFLRSGGAFSTGESAMPYPVYVLVGTICWQIFVDAVNGPLKIINTSKHMLVKINFPRESLIIAGMLITLFNFVVRLIVLIPALMFFSWQGLYSFSPESLILFPLGVIAIILLGYAIGILLTPLGILYTDIVMGIQIVMMMWMFISPVVITVPDSGLVAQVMELNPITPLLDTARCWLVGISATYLTSFWIVSTISICLILLGWILYRIALPHVIARLGM